jgi:very-short-patch-repair endonuclease
MDTCGTFACLSCWRASGIADLIWADQRLIIEIDGSPFHQDVGEDARKEAVWRAAGWTVLRLPSDAVYSAREQLLALAPRP